MTGTSRLKGIALLALCLFLVPAIGWLTGMYITSQYDGQFREAVVGNKTMTAEEFDQRGLSYVTFCQNARASDSTGELDKFCSYADEISYVQLASEGTAALGLLLLVLIFGGRMAAGTSRARLSLLFGPVVRGVMLLLAMSVLAQGALFVYCAYTLEATAIHRVHFGILFAIGIGALLACAVLLKSAVVFLKTEPLWVRGQVLKRDTHPAIFELVEGVARKLGAQPPDHIIAGLEPNFFVTAAPVQLVGETVPLKGRTLFLSMSLMRLFTRGELTGVVGHELGHFRGDDVTYSMKFAPTYSRLGKALGDLSGQSSGGAADLGRIPALVALSTCLNEFASVERTIGRDRELLADKAGAEAASARALATALVKVSLYAPQWNVMTRSHISELSEGRTYSNLSQTYAGHCAGMSSGFDWLEVRALLGETCQSHPVDTHPQLVQRLQNLATPLDSISVEDCAAPDSSAIGLLPDADGLEEALSNLEARWLVAVGAAKLPAEQAST